MTNKPVLYLSAALSVLTAIAVGVLAVYVTWQPARTANAGVESYEPVRTSKTPPSFMLQNQVGEEVSLESLRGKVVMITAVFATCHAACPTIITEAKSALDGLTEDQRDDVAVVAITLDPEGDTEPKRKATAEAHGLEPPLFHYVNGDSPEEVLGLIEELGWARSVDEETGEIGHSNMFVLVDRQGKIAYTLTLDGDDQDRLGTSLSKLLGEAR